MTTAHRPRVTAWPRYADKGLRRQSVAVSALHREPLGRHHIAPPINRRASGHTGVDKLARAVCKFCSMVLLTTLWGTPRCAAQSVTGSPAATSAGPYIVLDEEPWQPTRPPVRMLGHVLAPAGELLAAIGCVTTWDPRTRTLTATKDQRVLKIWAGKTTATVDGQPHDLPVPTLMVGDTLYVPLQAVAEVFGGELIWDAATETASLSFVPPGKKVAGTLMQTFSGPPPAIIIFDPTAAAYRAIAVTAAAKVTLRETGRPATPATLKDLRMGDWVVAFLDENDQAKSLTAEYKKVEGTVQRSEGGTVLLEDGTALRLMETAALVDAAGKRVLPDKLGPGAVIRARVNPNTGVAGWVVVLTPAPQQPAVTITTAGIVNFRNFGPGDAVQVRMQGTAKGRGSFDVDGFVQDVPMREVTPGVYEGEYVFGPTDQERQSFITCKLAADGQVANFEVPGRFIVDGLAPRVVRVSPADGEEIVERRPIVSVEYRDEGAGVDFNSVVLRLDGQDVSAALELRATGCTYSVPTALNPGLHTVDLALSDRVGNQTKTQWRFRVAAPAVAQKILYVKHNAAVALGQGQTLVIEVGTTEPGKQCWVDLGPLRLHLARQPNTNIYRVAYKVKPADNVVDGELVATFIDGAGKQFQLAATTKVNLRGDLPAGVAITSPKDGERITGPFRVAGRGQPGTQVHVVVTYTKQLLIEFTGELYRATVTADENGNWQTEEIDPEVPLLGVPDAFTITAQVTDAEGNVASKAQVTARGG